MKNDIILNSPKITKGILILSIPIIISNLLKLINELVDVYLIKNLDISQELLRSLVSALTMTSPIISVFQAVLIAFCAVELTLISQSIGEKNKEKTQKLLGELFILSFAIGIILNFLLIISCEPLLKLMKTTENPLIYKYGKEYIIITSFEMTSFLISRLYFASRYAVKDVISPMILSICQTILNIIITKILIGNYLIVGVALGTVVSSIVMIPIYLYLLVKTKTEEVKLKMWFSIDDFKKIINLVIPASISGIITALGFILINRQVMSFENYKIASIGTSSRIYNFIMIPFVSFQTLTTTFVSQNIGAKNYERVQKVILIIIKVALSLSMIVLSVSLIFKDYLINLFIKNDNEVISFSGYYLKYLLWTVPIMAYFYVLIGIFQGFKKMKLTLGLALVRLWILRLPLLVLFTRYYNMQVKGVILSIFISNIGTVIVGTIFLLFYYVKTLKTRTKNINIRQGEI